MHCNLPSTSQYEKIIFPIKAYCVLPKYPQQCSFSSHSKKSAAWVATAVALHWVAVTEGFDRTSKNWLLSVKRQKKNLSNKIQTKVAITCNFQLEEFVFICLIPLSSWIFGRTNILGDVPWSHLLFTFHMWYSCMTNFTQIQSFFTS